jgi:iron-sulfur cluster assembly protein
MFTLTAAAAEQIRRAAEAEDGAGALARLRVAAKIDDGDDGGGLSYGMGFDEERENDLVIESEGVTVLISPPSQSLLEETTLDFIELHPGEFQFIFLNPHEQELCAGHQRPGGCSSCGSKGECG